MNNSAIRRRLLIIGSLGVSVLIGLGAILFHFGSLAAFGAFIQGHSLYCDDPVKRCFAGTGSENHEVIFPITNLTGEPIRIIGADTTCGCLIAEGLPTNLASRATSEIRLAVKTKGVTQSHGERVKLLTDPPVKPITLRVMVEPKVN